MPWRWLACYNAKMIKDSQHPFEKLTPELIMDAIESQGHRCDGRVNALNSYENRVYQVGLEDEKQPFVIVKFYRPGRWSYEQIQEEHDFTNELLVHEIPVVTCMNHGKDYDKHHGLFEYGGFYCAVFKQIGGYAPELDHADNLSIMSRLLARLHLIGEKHLYQYRPVLDVASFGEQSVDFISQEFIPFQFKSEYLAICDDLLSLMKSQLCDCHNIRVHGDLHIGNILMREDVPFLVDFDDSRLAPAIQDIWMLLSGAHDEQVVQLQKIITAYEFFRPFPYQELAIIESLRTLRMLYHCAWLAQRWDDPAFAVAFPWFDDNSYWLQHIQDLRNQVDALQQNNLLESLHG